MRDLVRKLGQRFLAGFHGHEASSEIRSLIRDFGIGHVILFARNVDSPAQVARLCGELQELNRRVDSDIPLLIAVDQEGGRVARLREPWTVWPPLRALGRIGDERLAQEMGAALAAELGACGIRWNMAPVVDVDTNPNNPIINDRSFGEVPEIVGRLGVALSRGLEAGGVASCAKHFPGHGDTDIDSHLELPSVGHSRSRLEDIELRPFRDMIEAGIASIMTAHVLVREWDDGFPATLSPVVIGELLRGQMGYRGVVVSDDLEMRAIAKHWDVGEAAVKAASAGCDVLAVCATAELQVRALEALIHATESGALPKKPFDDSGERIRRLKERFALPHEDPDPRRAGKAAGRPESQALASEIAERGGY